MKPFEKFHAASESDCHDSGAASHGHHGDCENMEEKFFCLAMEARKELLKEKIKKHIEASCGDKMDDVAKLIAEASGEYIGLFMQGKQLRGDFKQKLKSIFQA